MKKKVWIISISLLMLAPLLTLMVLYHLYKIQQPDQPPFFDLFIADTFYEPDDPIFYKVDTNQNIPVSWTINKGNFEVLDSVFIGFENKTGEKFYFVTWGYPNSRLEQDLIIYKNNQVDSIPFDSFGCGTGIFLWPAYDKEIVGDKQLHPLMFNPYSGYDLPMESDSLPFIFKELYGDSVSIRFRQATYNNPWSKYKFRDITSDYITISTDKILENWKQGKYARLPQREPTLEEHFGLKRIRDH